MSMRLYPSCTPMQKSTRNRSARSLPVKDHFHDALTKRKKPKRCEQLRPAKANPLRCTTSTPTTAHPTKALLIWNTVSDFLVQKT